MYAVHDLEAVENDTPRLEGCHALQEFKNVFPDEIPEVPPKEEISFITEPVLGAALVSKTPCRMSTPKFLEMKMQLQGLLEKKYTKPSVYLWGAPVLFVKKKYGTLRFCIDYR